jgi:hypothetical protein
VRVIVVTAGKGAPGVTTTAVALAAVWPRPVVLVECDPAGGDLPYLLTAESGEALTATRGIVSLAAATRTDSRPDLAEHLQRIAGGLRVLVGPATRAQSQALSPSWTAVIGAIAGHDADVVVDCGQLGPGDDSTRHLVAAADLTVVVARATAPSVAHTREVMHALGRPGDGTAPTGGPVFVAVIGDSGQLRQAGQALASHTPVLVAGVADDPGGARGLRGQWSRRLDRSPIVVSVRALAQQADRMTAPAAAGGWVPSAALDGAPTVSSLGLVG